MLSSNFSLNDFSEFMYTMRDLNESLKEWGKNSTNTWDMKIKIGKDQYYIEIELNEGKNKSK